MSHHHLTADNDRVRPGVSAGRAAGDGSPSPRAARRWLWPALLCAVLAACVTTTGQDNDLHRWWSGLGPVLPHDTFPADCKLCHAGKNWNQLVATFRFDHKASTGVALNGAHAAAMCLRCHNDRGPVRVFAQAGCAGCHQDPHRGRLSTDCADCHDESSWRAHGQRQRHDRTRFPLSGAHATVACHRCHSGGRVGEFAPLDTACVSCHRDELQQTTNPPHVPLGLVDNCQRCHMPTRWRQTR